MEPLLNEFTVHRSIEHTWAVLTNVERIAPCMKG
ncbi:MAG: membrane oxidoreductase, partial [Actinobacteria bacterium]|nr:membrane oxidoreductase [Actinomycetota bacterium]